MRLHECEYECEFHKGKTEFHHPISVHPEVGFWLCEAHHSILQGRKKRYTGEIIVDKTLEDMRIELKAQELGEVFDAGYAFGDIDKH